MLISHDPNRDSPFVKLPAFLSAWPAGGWSWDNRFGCVASTISQAVSDEGWSAAKNLFATTWDKHTLSTAPVSIAKVASDTGGVRSGQFLFSTETTDRLLFYGLWWPWGEEGSNISMRVGLAGNPTRDETSRLRTLFRVNDE